MKNIESLSRNRSDTHHKETHQTKPDSREYIGGHTRTHTQKDTDNIW